MNTIAKTGHWLSDQVITDTFRKAGANTWANLSPKGQLELCRATLCVAMVSKAPGKEISWEDCRAAHSALIIHLED
jgi:hypothetical protein